MRFSIPSRSLNNKGFTLIDLMVAMGLGSIAVITTITIISQAGRVRRAESLLTSALAVRQQLFQTLVRYDNFQETIHSNAQFNCLKPPTHQCGVTSGWPVNTAAGSTPAGSNFNVMVAFSGGYSPTFNSTVLYNAANPNVGFTEDGLACTSTTLAPNARCPIRADLYWWSICSGVCNPGLIKIRVIIRTYNIASKTTHTTPYGFELIKSVYDDGTQGPFP